MSTLLEIWGTIQRQLFPSLEDEIGPLSAKERNLVQIIALLDLPRHMSVYQWQGWGRKPKSRLAMCKAFVAKAVYRLETTDLLIEYLKGCSSLRRLCGFDNAWQVPSKATFSRAFAQFSKDQVLNDVLAGMLKGKLGDKVVGHISRDSTSIEAREKPVRKKVKVKVKRKRGRPRKSEVRSPKPKKRLELQPERALSENLAELPAQCDFGIKKNSKGHRNGWIGYKLHLDCADGDIPISAVLTSASVHDSQVAIALAQMSAERVTSLYDLMDAAYDAPQIHAYSKRLGHVPIIDHNPRSGEKKLMDPATKTRFGKRSCVERVNSDLKDNFGGDHIRVKGASKVMTHLMFGLVAIAAKQIIRMIV
jgi:hypothetical protein